MNTKAIRAIAVNIKPLSHDEIVQAVSEVTIKKFEDYYTHLECDSFDVVRVEWFGKEVSIYVDDEGMLKENYGRNVLGYSQPLFGNMVITGGVDEEGNTLSLDASITTSNIDTLIDEVRYAIR